VIMHFGDARATGRGGPTGAASPKCMITARAGGGLQ
jgi:hypothetical protein